jgi:uncharacterized protein (TIGR00375 family)
MKFAADFHLHSKYSRATSRNMDLDNLDKWAKIKGIKVLGTGDFTHPEWFKSLREKLEPAEQGLYRLKSEIRNPKSETRFILTAEISCIYSKTTATAKVRKEDSSSLNNNRVRKIHILVFAPSFEIAEKINAQLGWIGNLRSDGRPILGLDAKELAKIVLNTSPECLVIPAHAWTPWFAIFGSKSGFDSIEECFEEYTPHIYAIETGLSSDPLMNWRLSALDKITLISNSDSHSPQKIGREANVFDTEINYSSICQAIKDKDPQKLLYTIEFYPEEGKYHYDGHRNCGIVLSPKETKKYNGICPVCGKPLTVGVLNRLEQLADREEGIRPEGAIPFKSLVPLEEIIADAVGQTPGTKQVEKEYKNLIDKFGSEFSVLLDIPRENLEGNTLPEIAEGIMRVRSGDVVKEAGYDGVYGKIKVFSQEERKEVTGQDTLF